MDRNTQVGTDRPCIWDIPRKVSVPTKIDDLDVRYNKNNPCIAPTSAAFHSSKVHEQSLRDVECHLYRLCKGSDSLLLHVLEPPSDDSDEEIKDEQPPNMTNYMSEFIREKVNTDFLTFLKSKCDINLISKIEILQKVKEIVLSGSNIVKAESLPLLHFLCVTLEIQTKKIIIL